MKALVTYNIEKDMKLAYSNQDVDVYYRWSPKISWIQFNYKRYLKKKLILNFYVAPTKDGACVYMAYIPKLDGIGQYLTEDKFDWEELFNTIPILGQMFKNVGNKDNASSYVAFLKLPHENFDKVGMICTKVKNHPYPKYDICLLDNSFIDAIKVKEIGERLQCLLKDIELFYNQYRVAYKKLQGFNWKKFLLIAGKVALVAAVLLAGGDMDFPDLSDYTGGDLDIGDENIDEAVFSDASNSNIDNGNISFKGSMEDNSAEIAEIEKELRDVESNISYYEKEQRTNMQYAENRSDSYITRVNNNLHDSIRKKEELLRKLSSLK